MVDLIIGRFKEAFDVVQAINPTGWQADIDPAKEELVRLMDAESMSAHQAALQIVSRPQGKSLRVAHVLAACQVIMDTQKTGVASSI